MIKKLSFLKVLANYYFFLLILITSVCAQPSRLQFKHITTNDGLSQSWIHSVIQDKYGFIWMGSEDGLNRYDGHSFRVFKNNIRDQYSISNNGILTLFENSKGDLWIGTRKGLNLYDRKNDRFIWHPRWSDRITSIAEDKNKIMWVGTGSGLYSLDLKNDSVNNYSIPGNLSRNSVSRFLTGQILKIYVDSRNNVWIGSSNGLHLYIRADNSFINYYHDENNPSSISSDDVRTILEDSAGRLWIGTSAGLDLFVNNQEHSQKGKFIHYQNKIGDKRSISNGPVMALFEDNKHNLWIGIQNGGLDVINLDTYNKNTLTFTHFKNDPNKENSLSNNSIYSIIQDKQGNIWISTFGKGMNIINPLGDRFIHYKSETGSKNSLSDSQVNTFLEDNDILWIGTEGGLNRYNKKEDTFKHYVHNPLDKKSIGSNAVWAICKDRRGNLWIGTWGGGLNKFNYKTETFEHYYNDPYDTNSIGSNNMFSIFEDSKGDLWIGTMGGGLNMFDYKKNRFIRYTSSNAGLYTDYVPSIMETKSGELWLSNENSFGRFNRKTKQFENFMHSDNDSTSLSSNKAISIYEDSKGNLWMGTDAGLNLFNKVTKAFKCYRTDDGLPDNAILSIVEDKHGNLWLSTDKGLSKFINAINLPVKPEFRNYGYEDGLQGNEFCPRSSCKGVDGKLYFGGPNGFNVFDSDKIIENTYIPPIVITGFNVFNKPQLLGERGINKDLESTEDIVLSNEQSMFSFEFAALNYISSFKNQYAYKLEGFDKDWNYIGIKHTATYTNLEPGKYIFRVKGSNNDGVWNEEGISLRIIITPPFWKTIWFYGLILIVIGAIVYQIYKWRVQVRNLAEKKSIDEAVAKERNLLRALIDSVPDRIYVKDLEGRFIIINKAVETKLGIEKSEQIIGKTDFDFYAPELADRYHNDDKIVIKSGQPVINREELSSDYTGNQKWTLTTKIPLRDSQSQIIGLVGTGSDITERKLVEEALSQKTALLEAQLNSSIDGILIVGSDGRKILQNQRTVELWNIPKEIAENPDDQMQVAHVMHATKDPEQFVKQVKYLYSHPNETSQDEIELKDGTILDRYSAPVIGSDGRNHGRIWSFHDITDLKRAEEALRLQSAALDAAANAIVITDTNGNFLWINQSFTLLTGYKPEEVIGKNPRDLVKSGKHDKLFYKQLWETIFAGNIWNGEMINRRKDGSLYTEEQTITPLKDRTGKISHFIAIKQDISKRKMLEEELRQLQKLESLGTLAGGVAHDFNNILGIILAYSSVLENASKIDQNKFSESIKAINSAVSRGAALVRQILTFARQTDIAIRPMSVSELAHETVTMLQETFPKIIEFKERFEKGVPLINADHSQIHQAILNLCVNARDAMSNGGTITIGVETSLLEKVIQKFPNAKYNRYVCLSLADTGTGMDKETKNRIFDPFFTTKELGKGTGLGLSVVYGVIQSHQGFVNVESELGKGTTFYLYLPIPQEVHKNREIDKAKSDISNRGSEAILFVEDEELLRKAVASTLESNGYTVYIAVDGSDAIQVYKQHQKEITLVLTDMGLPKKTGLDVFLELRQMNPNLKTILASGFISVDQKSELLKAGAIDFIQKPYVLSEVLQKIRDVMDK